MGNEQKQENLNNQNIQEQEPKQMMPYVDNQDMKERATRFGTGGFAAIIYAVVTTICLYKNAYGIMTVLFAAATIGFLYYVCSHAPQSKAYDNREDTKYHSSIDISDTRNGHNDRIIEFHDFRHFSFNSF